MKINITIEIDDKELKGLLFGEEKTEEEPSKLYCLGKEAVRRQRLRSALDILRDIAEKYGQVTVADYKDAYISVGLCDKLPYCLDDHIYGWSRLDVENMKIIRDIDGISQLKTPPVKCINW